MSTRTHLFWEAVLQLGECRSSRGVLRWPLGGGGSSWRRRSRRRRQGRGAAWRRRWSFGAQGYLTSSGVQLITVSLGWVPVASRRTGMTQGNPPWQFALRQGVTDLLEVFAELVLPESHLNTTGCSSGYEMSSVLQLQLFNLERVNLKIQHVHKALRLTEDTTEGIVQSTAQPRENIYWFTSRQMIHDFVLCKKIKKRALH